MNAGRHAVTAMLRRRFLSAPLLLPLFAVLGILWGGYACSVTVAAVLLAGICRVWRILIACVLCSAVILLHLAERESSSNRLLDYLSSKPGAPLIGTVQRSLKNGCLFQEKDTGATLMLKGELAHWKAGDCLRATVALQAVSKAAIPGMFDQEAWLQSQGVTACATCLSADFLGHPLSLSSIRGMADDLRAALARKLMPAGSENDKRAQVLCALVLGDKTYSEPETVEIFKKGGCLHIFAVSGLHVGVISCIVLLILGRFFQRSRGRTCALILLTGVYVFITGLAVPALRAFLMLALFLVGKELKRSVSMANIWSAAALLILLLYPWQIYNAGFLLSFAVYAAIVIGISIGMKASPWFHPDPFIPSKIYTKGERRLLHCDFSIRSLVVMSLSAWLASLPITMYYFKTFNLYGVLINLAITPLLLPTMLSGLLAFLPYIGTVFLKIALCCTSVLLSMVGTVAEMPAAYLPAQQERSASSFLVYDTGYGGSFTVLGNPGVMINCGSEVTAQLTTEPALFFGGFHPSMLILTQRRASAAGGAEYLCKKYPHLQVVHGYELRDDIISYRLENSTVTIIPARSELRESPIQNTSPIILWQHSQRSVLYVGDASRDTYERIPAEYLDVDTVICGKNPAMPVEPSLVEQLSPRAEIVLLPSAMGYGQDALPVQSPVRSIPEGEQCLISEGAPKLGK